MEARDLGNILEIVGRNGVGVAMVVMGLLFILFIHPVDNSWQNMVAYIAAAFALLFGAYIVWMKIGLYK